jgi:hypothetical protein
MSEEKQPDVITQAELRQLGELQQNAHTAKESAEKLANQITKRWYQGAKIESGDRVFDPNHGLVCILADGVLAAFGESAGPFQPDPAPAVPEPRRSLLITVMTWLWVACMVGTCLAPPWLNNAGYTLGYTPVFKPPQGPVHIDQGRLLLEWAVVTVVACGVCLAPLSFRRKK